MKILDKYILKTFTITFTTVFVILFFIFILQTIWLFIYDLAGRDLDLMLIVKFLLFGMPRIIPLVLPLSVLLASIMTFGNLSENYEFAAMKSAGISLQRVMKTLTVFILFLSVLAFVFANNVIPYAEYKFINFRKNIAQRKPAMAIAEGQFSEIGYYTIKVDKKSGENGNHLTGITIHKKSWNGDGVRTVIKAKDGDLISNENSNILKLVLNNGYYYEDLIPNKYEDRNKIPFAKASFKKDIINLDLLELNGDQNNQNIANTTTMLNMSELNYTIDSLNKNYNRDLVSFADNIHQRSEIMNVNKAILPLKKDAVKADLLSLLSDSEKLQILQFASSSISSTIFSIDSSKDEMINKKKIINSHFIALYDKFVVAFACLMMFFIGAPLGAIIKKGGIGFPIIFAVLIFITFHFINTFGKRLANEDGISPFLGSWLSSIILTPMALLLTYRATNDIGLFNIDSITQNFQKLFQKLFPSQN
ncbi:MAG: YjgP/YjgQ family permease [Flavobacteriaceae bacterium]|nr:YjgP/YjgQ family permease [Flavobacteriaceae bacterium]